MIMFHGVLEQRETEQTLGIVSAQHHPKKMSSIQTHVGLTLQTPSFKTLLVKLVVLIKM